MTRSHVYLWARAGGVTHRNLGVKDSGEPLPDWFFTQGFTCKRPPRLTPR